jgi:hypothetical protein
MRNSLAILFVSTVGLMAQDGLQVSFPADAPLAVVSSGWGESRSIPRGGATVVDVKTSLKLKNLSRLRLRGISLQVSSQEVAPGGKASVSVPSLDVYPGQEFPVKIDLRLLQPQAAAGPAVVTVTLDGILYEDLSFYGPNRLGSRRQLTTWEIEARRDRQYLRGVLARQGEEGLKRAMVEILARENTRPRLDVRLARGSAALPDGKAVETAFLNPAEAPVAGVKAMARAAENRLQILELAFENRDRREVKSVELGLLVKDAEGREYSAGALPMPLDMKAGGKSVAKPTASITLNRSQGLPLKIESLTGFIQQVEFVNGDVWVPSSAFRDEARLTKLLPGSLEQQRLSEIYRRRGLAALVEELNRW